MNPDVNPILVIGGGISGMTAAVEIAEVGYPVVLVEKEAYLGGRVMRSHKYFPKMCPPSCGFEINARRIRNNPRIAVHTLSTVEEISGSSGAFRARIKTRPRFVTGAVPLDDGVAEGLTSERPDEFNMGMGTTKPLYYPHPAAYPALHVLDREALSDTDVATLTEAAPEGAIDLTREEKERWIDASAIIVATGWRPYDATKLDNLAFGQAPDVITNVMMERLAAPEGPTGGKILRPSDGEPPKQVAFVQCAGSRDENHLPYCSAVCCMASLKQTRYLREQDPDVNVTVFYIDIRTVGRLEDFYYDLLEDEKVTFVKGKVAGIEEASTPGNLTLNVEDTIAGRKPEPEFDMVVLATGIVPEIADSPIPFDLEMDEYGFLDGATNVEGVYAAGCAKHPCDVSRATKESTAAALKAIQCVKRG
ncbi:MAG: NAD(P)-binding protein [Thermodesulfobacteriota bacterium]|nr:NAD(P)-binding protein [Thermodesulfobacteriota bacterium]